MAVRTQVDKIELLDHGQGARPGDRPGEAALGATPVLVPELANAPTIEGESPDVLARTEEVIARAKASAKK